MTKRIIKEEHDKWLAKVLADQSNQRLFILEDIDASPCGQVRFSRTERDDWEIHFSMDPQYRGQRLGVQLIRAGLGAFFGQEHRSRITAKVKNGNAASLRILATAGFQGEESCAPNDSETRLIYIPK